MAIGELEVSQLLLENRISRFPQVVLLVLRSGLEKIITVGLMCLDGLMHLCIGLWWSRRF